jgi:cephalosporin hydroxylase
MKEFVKMDTNNIMFFYKNIRLEQRVEVIDALDNLYLELRKTNELPKTIIEIGMNHGGFSLVLNDSKISEQADIYCFDIVDREFNENLKNTKIKWFINDIFKVESFVKDLINRDGKTLLFCDGGHKAKEFNTFAKYLKSKDLIFSHDYHQDQESYDKNKDRWPWWESKLADLKDTCKIYNLQPFMQEEFEKCVWSCKIKA